MLARGLVGRIVRVAGWGLIILGMVAVSVIVTRGAFRAHSDAQFNRWTGWATILALSVAGVGVALVAWDRIVKIIWPDKESGQEPLTAEDKLSATRNAECELPGRPLTEETDPFALEVHRPVEADGGTSQDLPLLPPYVRRPHDEELARVTRIATEGRSGIAVLVGGSSTGKTRACWEALKTISYTSTPNTPWRLWHPIAPSHREAALKGLPYVAPCTVIWLNDAQLYLDTPDGEEVAADLRELLRDGKRAPILVLATLWPEHWSSLTAPPGYSAPDPHVQARELLTGHAINVPSAFTDMQLSDLAKADDPRLRQAASSASDGKVTQYLASAPELLSRYENAPHAPKALLQAAMDARRLGVGDSIPLSFLETAAPGYVTGWERNSLDDNWLPESLKYAGQPCKGALGPLTPIRQGPSASQRETYHLADYLDQHSHHTRHAIIPPLDFWVACETLTDRVELRELGNAAEARGILRNAARLHKSAAALGDTKAAARLVRRLHYLDPGTTSAAWPLIDDVTAGDIDAVIELVLALTAAGSIERTSALLASVMANVALDDPRKLAHLLTIARQTSVEEQGAKGCVGVLLARGPAAHASLDNLSDVAELVQQLRLSSGLEQAMSLMSRAAAEARLDDADGLSEFVRVMHRLGATEALAVLLERDPIAHVPLTSLLDLAKLLVSLHEAGAEKQAAALAVGMSSVPVERDHLEALETLVDELWESGAKESATALAHCASVCAGSGDPVASVLVAKMLDKVEAEEFVSALVERCPVELADLTDPSAVVELLNALQEAGAEEEVVALLKCDPAMSVACDDPEGVANLLYTLMEHGEEQQVAMLRDREPGILVALDLPASVASLLRAMWKAGWAEQVTVLAQRAAKESVNLTSGPGSLLNALRYVGAEAEVSTLVNRLPSEECFDHFLVEGDNKVVYRFGREPDGNPANRWSWEDLDLSRLTRRARWP